MSTSPFIVPPFDQATAIPVKYTWFSWHPCYPRWTRSCWHDATIEKAEALMQDAHCCGMLVYHNKLIREGGGLPTEEVKDLPCQRMEIWWKIAGQNRPELNDIRSEVGKHP